MSWFEDFRRKVPSANVFRHWIPGLVDGPGRNYRCLFHDDTTPSMSVDPVAGVFCCFGCGASGGVLDFFARVNHIDLASEGGDAACRAGLESLFCTEARAVVAEDPFELVEVGTDEELISLLRAAREQPELSLTDTSDGTEHDRDIDEAEVHKLVGALWSDLGHHARRHLIEERRLDEDTLKRFEVGWSAERRRIAFPVRDADGCLINIRMYSPKATGAKMVSYAKGYGSPAIYPLAAIAAEVDVVLCEGELDALTSNKHGIAAVTATGGATIDWKKNPKLCEPFIGKHVAIAYDRGETEPGVAAAVEIAKVMKNAGVLSVRILEWPDEALAACGGVKVDVNDFFVKAEANADDFRALLRDAKSLEAVNDPGPAAKKTTARKAGANLKAEVQVGSALRVIGAEHQVHVGQDSAEVRDQRDACATDAGQEEHDGNDDDDDVPLPAEGLGPLGQELWDLYYRVSKTGHGVARTGVPLSLKAAAVVGYLQKRGARFFFFESSSDVVFVDDGKWHSVSRGDEAFATFWMRCIRLFGMTTTNGKELVDAIEVEVRSHPTCLRVARPNWGSLDWTAGELYVALDPGKSKIVRIKPAVDGLPAIEEVDNGTDGVLLRSASSRARRFTYVPGALGEGGLDLFRDLFHRQQALSELERLGSTAYKLVALLPNLSQRPICFHQGGEHSGKTTAAQDFELILYGESRASGFNKPEELWYALDAAGPVVTQDNAESRTRVRFGTSYNRLSTGVSQRYRKLYRDGVLIDYHPNASLMLTAIESFTAPEDLDRAIEFEFDVEHHDARRLPRSKHTSLLREHGDLMLSALFELFSTCLLPDLEKKVEKAQAFIQAARPGHSKQRFNEFLSLMLVIFELIGEQLWDAARAGEAYDAQRLFLEFLDSQTRKHRKNSAAVSQEVYFLNALRLKLGRRDPFSDPDPEGIRITRSDTTCVLGPVTSSTLFSIFSTMSSRLGVQRLPWDGPPQFGQRMKAAARPGGALAAAGWTREGVGKAHDNVTTYLFTYTEAVAVPAPLAVADQAASEQDAGAAMGMH